MPLTFIQIEEEKNRRIWLFFLVLIVLYLAILAALAAAYGLAPILLANPAWILVLFAVSLPIASAHFFLTTLETAHWIKGNLGAMEPDPKDGIHKRFLNVLEEVRIVTGRQRKIDGVVIPSLAMNALAVVDLRGNATIGITEGLLSRLTRPQLEAVVAHEAHHILSGDCLETTIASSLFGLPSAALEKISNSARGRAFLSPAVILAWILLKLSLLLNLFISREREYRADAGAVRITRNPMALAEVLHLLSRNWRGVGSIGDGFEMLCIVNPAAKALDESEGWWADLMSTHPPIQKRIETALSMAHADLSQLTAQTRANRTPPAADRPAESVFFALDPKQLWQGPYALAELSNLPWISPLTWVGVNGEAVERAWKIAQIDPVIFTKRLAREEKPVSSFPCPSCRQPLLETSYERTQVYQCHFCGGILVENAKIPRIMARGENAYSERVASLSRTVMKENRARRVGPSSKNIHREALPLRSCPKCKNPMTRTFHSLAYLVEIDRCSFCGLTWFDPDELEMLQCMIVNKMAADPLEQKKV